MPETLRFNTNIPVQLALDNEYGKHVEGRYGEQVMYSLTDGRVMYVPPFVEQRLAELAVSAREPLEICKAEVQNGHRRWIEWHVKRLESPLPARPGNGTTVEVLPATETNGNGNGRDHAYLPANGSRSPSGNGSAPTALGNLLPMQISGSGMPAMESAMNEAVNIARRVEAGAASQSYYLKFTASDVRSIGVSIFIQMSREATKW